MTKVFFRFQLVNLAVSLLLYFAGPIVVAGVPLITPLFIGKIIGFMWFNRFPRSRDLASVAFFALACVEVYLIFVMGNFSIYTYLLARIL
ncbi:MAG: hypothetical protein GTO62_07545 [Planctomycetales bacterium]|nr:hypothetical protein [Planctomycetales bacterium]